MRGGSSVWIDGDPPLFRAPDRQGDRGVGSSVQRFAPWMIRDSLRQSGCCMDIVGIVLLFLFGAIGGKWIDKPVVTFVSVKVGAALARNERRARWGSWVGLLSAVAGFGLQIYAQWL